MPPKNHIPKKSTKKFKLPPGVVPFPGQWLPEKPNHARDAASMTKEEQVAGQFASTLLARKGKLTDQDLKRARIYARKLLWTWKGRS